MFTFNIIMIISLLPITIIIYLKFIEVASNYYLYTCLLVSLCFNYLMITSFPKILEWIKICKKIGLSNKQISETLSVMFDFRK